MVLFSHFSLYLLAYIRSLFFSAHENIYTSTVHDGDVLIAYGTLVILESNQRLAFASLMASDSLVALVSAYLNFPRIPIA